jgi:DNA-binding NarL/FixJ family response regulator
MTAEPATVPVLVIEGPPGCSTPDVERLRATGSRIIDGFRPPLHAPGAVCVGVVDSEATAVAALLAVLAGAGLVAEARADRATIDRLVDDLRRRGFVDHRVVGARGVASTAGEPDLSVEGRAILGMLAMGLSLGEAAHVLGLGRRTADRRLAEARRDLGVTRTTEAIAKARRLGWLELARDRQGSTGAAREG